MMTLRWRFRLVGTWDDSQPLPMKGKSSPSPPSTALIRTRRDLERLGVLDRLADLGSQGLVGPPRACARPEAGSRLAVDDAGLGPDEDSSFLAVTGHDYSLLS
jgi:hypothetical protein